MMGDARARIALRHQNHGGAVGIEQHRQPQQAGNGDDERHQHFERRTDERSVLRRTQVLGHNDALNLEKIRAPVTESHRNAKAKDHPEPVDAHGIAGKRAQIAPQAGKVGVLHRRVDDRDVFLYGGHQVVPAAGVDNTEDGDEQRPQPDEKKLQHFVEHRGQQPAQSHIDGHGDRGHPDADVHVPAQQQV
ncbi:MAG: hypothetical protein BWY83_03404 [bacterium ADurb.Bin478]|nr:MAG: hypothetical protein BWY83_03404 [bacterium ADurb.Bin478]